MYQWEAVESSSIKNVGWHCNRTLRVVFHNGGIYDYSDVPMRVFEEMIENCSIGRFYNNEIKGEYESSSESRFWNDAPFNNLYEAVENISSKITDKEEQKLLTSTVYVVYEEQDATIPISEDKIVGYFADEKVANYVLDNEASCNKKGKSKGLMSKGIYIIDVDCRTFEEYKDSKKDVIRRKALAKLSKEEREVLGFPNF